MTRRTIAAAFGGLNADRLGRLTGDDADQHYQVLGELRAGWFFKELLGCALQWDPPGRGGNRTLEFAASRAEVRVSVEVKSPVTVGYSAMRKAVQAYGFHSHAGADIYDLEGSLRVPHHRERPFHEHVNALSTAT